MLRAVRDLQGCTIRRRDSAHVRGGHTCRTPQRMSSQSDRQPAARRTIEATVVNPIKALQAFGQSVWLDYLRRSLFTSGEFSRLITEDGLRGVTSNPSIFEKAIAGSTDYLDALQEIERRA